MLLVRLLGLCLLGQPGLGYPRVLQAHAESLENSAVCLLQKDVWTFGRKPAHGHWPHHDDQKHGGHHGKVSHTGSSRRPGKTPGTIQTTGFSWNSHWQCSQNPSCRHSAISKFVELVKDSAAEFAVAIELEVNSREAIDLSKHGLTGWSQVDGICDAAYGDVTSVAVAPGYVIDKSGGGCLSTESDSRAFAVVKVKPPFHVRGCEALCLLGVHIPHLPVIRGMDTVQDVCGDLVEICTIAMGDWNRPGDQVVAAWSNLIGGSVPHIVEPNRRTCCWPESRYADAWYDHLATNIPNSTVVNTVVYDYPVTDLKPESEHRPVAVSITLPS